MRRERLVAWGGRLDDIQIGGPRCPFVERPPAAETAEGIAAKARRLSDELTRQILEAWGASP